MITLHHLQIGRSIFTVWLLEEVGVEYKLKSYLRDPQTMRALNIQLFRLSVILKLLCISGISLNS